MDCGDKELVLRLGVWICMSSQHLVFLFDAILPVIMGLALSHYFVTFHFFCLFFGSHEMSGLHL